MLNYQRVPSWQDDPHTANWGIPIFQEKKCSINGTSIPTKEAPGGAKEKNFRWGSCLANLEINYGNRQFSIAMESGPFIDDLPIKHPCSISKSYILSTIRSPINQHSVLNGLKLNKTLAFASVQPSNLKVTNLALFEDSDKNPNSNVLWQIFPLKRSFGRYPPTSPPTSLIFPHFSAKDRNAVDNLAPEGGATGFDGLSHHCVPHLNGHKMGYPPFSNKANRQGSSLKDPRVGLPKMDLSI